MSTRAFGIGIQKIAEKTFAWLTDNMSAMQIDLTQADTAVKLITAATVASPAVITSTSHGFSNGDIVVVRGVVGMVELNQTAKVANVTTNTYTLQTLDGLAINGTNAYTSGGSAINLTLAATMNDINAGRVGTDQTLASKTDVNGLLNCAAITFTSVASRVDGLVIYFNGGSDGTSFPLFFIDGKMMVRVAADAASSATTLWTERLQGALAAQTFVTSNAVSVAASAASQFARSITVTALPSAIANGHQADVPTSGAGLPFTGGGGSYTYTPDTAANKLFNLNSA